MCTSTHLISWRWQQLSVQGRREKKPKNNCKAICFSIATFRCKVWWNHTPSSLATYQDEWVPDELSQCLHWLCCDSSGFLSVDILSEDRSSAQNQSSTPQPTISWHSMALKLFRVACRVYSKHLVQPFGLAGDQLSTVLLAEKHQTHIAGEWHSNQLGQDAVKAISVPLESAWRPCNGYIKDKKQRYLQYCSKKKMHIQRLTSHGGIRSIIITFLISH